MSEVLEQLPNNFYMCHRSIIVNIEKILKREHTNCRLKNNIEIPIGREKVLEFKDYYVSYFSPF